MAKLEIKGDSLVLRPFHGHVILDGHEIKGIRRLVLWMDVSEVTWAHIEVQVDDIHVDAEILTELNAILKKQEAENGRKND